MEKNIKKEHKLETLNLEIQKSESKIEELSNLKAEVKSDIIAFLNQGEKLKIVRKAIDKLEDCTTKITKHQKQIEKAKQKLEKQILKSVEPEIEPIPAPKAKTTAPKKAAPSAKKVVVKAPAKTTTPKKPTAVKK